MVKYKPVKENSFREYFSYLVAPLFNFSGDLKYSHRYKKNSSNKNITSYFNRFISDNKIKQIYRFLDFLHLSSHKDFEEQKKQGVITSGLHPIEEQSWYINYLKPKIITFKAEDIWQVMLDYGQRDKYSRFLSKQNFIDRFEIFMQNYFFSAVSSHVLVEIFLLAFEGEEADREERLAQFLNCLCYKQALQLLETLKLITTHEKHWRYYCHLLIKCMRNAQIKHALILIPEELEDFALEKLYPYEIIEVIELLDDLKRKERVVQKVLTSAKEWWSEYSQEDIQQVLAILRSQ